MATLEDYRENNFVNYCTRALETFAAETPGVKNVLLATPDGFEIASHAEESKHSADSLAAVGSSLFALGASLISEFSLGATRAITIDSEKGKVYISSVQAEDKALIILISPPKTPCWRTSSTAPTNSPTKSANGCCSSPERPIARRQPRAAGLSS